MQLKHYVAATLLISSVASPGWCVPDAYFSGKHEAIVTDVRGQPIPNAVVTFAWVLEPDSGEPEPSSKAYRLQVQQVLTNQIGRFEIPAWRKAIPRPPGLKVASGLDPLVTLHAAGYHSMHITNMAPRGHPRNASEAEIMEWQFDGARLQLRPLPVGEAARATELNIWYRSIQANVHGRVARVGLKGALAEQNLLIDLLDLECGELSEAYRQQLCNEEVRVKTIALEPGNRPIVVPIADGRPKRTETTVVYIPASPPTISAVSPVP